MCSLMETEVPGSIVGVYIFLSSHSFFIQFSATPILDVRLFFSRLFPLLLSLSFNVFLKSLLVSHRSSSFRLLLLLNLMSAVQRSFCLCYYKLFWTQAISAKLVFAFPVEVEKNYPHNPTLEFFLSMVVGGNKRRCNWRALSFPE